MQNVDADGWRHLRQLRLRKTQVIVELLLAVHNLLPKKRKRKKRVKTKQLPYHKRRRRVDWEQWVRELGTEDFYRHHRMPRESFEKLLNILKADIERDGNKNRYGSGPITARMQLTITLKHLAGDASHDIEKHMGGKFALLMLLCEYVSNICLCLICCSFPVLRQQDNCTSTASNRRQIGSAIVSHRRRGEARGTCTRIQGQVLREIVPQRCWRFGWISATHLKEMCEQTKKQEKVFLPQTVLRSELSSRL